MKHARRRQRNYLVKKLREDKQFRPRRIERKKPEPEIDLEDDDGDYTNLHWWLRGRN